MVRSQVDSVPQEIMQLYNFFNKITQKVTWKSSNPMQAQTEPKLHPETANMEFEQVITKLSVTSKGDLKVNLERKWFLRRFP